MRLPRLVFLSTDILVIALLSATAWINDSALFSLKTIGVVYASQEGPKDGDRKKTRWFFPLREGSRQKKAESPGKYDEPLSALATSPEVLGPVPSADPARAGTGAFGDVLEELLSRTALRAPTRRGVPAPVPQSGGLPEEKTGSGGGGEGVQRIVALSSGPFLSPHQTRHGHPPVHGHKRKPPQVPKRGSSALSHGPSWATPPEPALIPPQEFSSAPSSGRPSQDPPGRTRPKPLPPLPSGYQLVPPTGAKNKLLPQPPPSPEFLSVLSQEPSAALVIPVSLPWQPPLSSESPPVPRLDPLYAAVGRPLQSPPRSPSVLSHSLPSTPVTPEVPRPSLELIPGSPVARTPPDPLYAAVRRPLLSPPRSPSLLSHRLPSLPAIPEIPPVPVESASRSPPVPSIGPSPAPAAPTVPPFPRPPPEGEESVIYASLRFPPPGSLPPREAGPPGLSVVYASLRLVPPSPSVSSPQGPPPIPPHGPRSDTQAAPPVPIRSASLLQSPRAASALTRGSQRGARQRPPQPPPRACSLSPPSRSYSAAPTPSGLPPSVPSHRLPLPRSQGPPPSPPPRHPRL